MKQSTLTVIQWLLVLGVAAGIYFLWKGHLTLPDINLSSVEIIIISLSLAFTWVEVLKIGVTKPFNCVSCLTGWIALIVGVIDRGWSGIIFLFIGLFVGALFEAIKMRL